MSDDRAAKLLAIAANEIGGYFPTVSPYGEWYDAKYGGGKGVYRAAQYCAMFVSWCAEQAGLLGTVIPAHAYTPSGAAWFNQRGLFTPGVKGIQRGDVWYSSASGIGRISHVGYVERVMDDGSFYTIEGNTSITAAGSQNNGRRVARKHRYTAGSLGGYGRPNYPAIVTPTVPATTEPTSVETDEENMKIYSVAGGNGYWVVDYSTGVQRRLPEDDLLTLRRFKIGEEIGEVLLVEHNRLGAIMRAIKNAAR